MGERYRSVQSPRDSEMPGEFGDERFRKLVQETSKGISSFNQVTRGIAQKMSLFGTPQDSRANHTQVTELTDKGHKLVSRLNKRLQELNKACQSGNKRAMRKAQVSKLSSDFKAQLKSFEDTCKRLVETERHSVDLIRRSSTSFKGGQKPAGNEFSNYNEDQIYAQANVVIYDEDGASCCVDDTVPVVDGEANEPTRMTRRPRAARTGHHPDQPPAARGQRGLPGDRRAHPGPGRGRRCVSLRDAPYSFFGSRLN